MFSFLWKCKIAAATANEKKNKGQYLRNKYFKNYLQMS